VAAATTCAAAACSGGLDFSLSRNLTLTLPHTHLKGAMMTVNVVLNTLLQQQQQQQQDLDFRL